MSSADALQAETVEIPGNGADNVEAYLAHPVDGTPRGGVIVIHHMPGYDEPTKEITRKIADHGYLAICPNLYSREAPGAVPDEAAAKVRALGGVPDDRLVGDVQRAASYLRALPSSNGKLGVVGFCSGGRQAFLAACRLGLEAAVDCYGAFVVNKPPETIPLKIDPVAHLVGDLSCPLLGIFGVEDQNPSPEEVQQLDEMLSSYSKTHEFHSYENAGHAFLATDRPSYRPDAATDAWTKIWVFLGRYL